MKNSLLVTVIFGLMLTSACTTKKSDAEKDPHAVSKSVEERVRPAASGGTSAAYFSYTNSQKTTDTLLSVQADFATMTQLHESYKTEDGMMGMREQGELVVQPGEEIQFKQGGLHVMLMGLNQDLKRGDSVTVTMNFALAGEVVKKLPVKP